MVEQDRAGDARQMVIGVVGCGYWGSKHVRVISGLPGVEAVVVEADENRRLELCGNLGIERSFASLEEAVGIVDGIVIATPAQSHHVLGMMAIEAGLHVLIEKPLALSVQECEDLIRAADARSLTLMVGHTFEYNPSVWKLRQVIDEEDFGDVLYLNAARLNLGMYQSDINVVWDLAPHDLSIFNYLLRATPDSVAMWGSSHLQGREDVAYLQMTYDSLNVTANCHLSWLDPNKVRRTTVVGRQKMAVYDDLLDEPVRVYERGVEPATGADLHEQPIRYRNGDIISPFVESREPLQVEDNHFVTCIRTGARPQSDGRSGLAVVQVLCAADEALRTGQRVAVTPATIDLRETADGPLAPQLSEQS